MQAISTILCPSLKERPVVSVSKNISLIPFNYIVKIFLKYLMNYYSQQHDHKIAFFVYLLSVFYSVIKNFFISPFDFKSFQPHFLFVFN